MESKQVIATLEPWIKRHARPAWRPIVQEGDGHATASKFCGLPWTGPGEPWPDCAACKEPMALALQLHTKRLPFPIKCHHRSGLLQLFYCRNNSLCSLGNSWFPFACHLSRVRLITPAPRGKGAAPPANYEPPEAPARLIVGWEEFEDHPNGQEHEAHGLLQDSNREDTHIRCSEVDLDVRLPIWLDRLDKRFDSATGDKLGGWSHWVQGVEYPFCPRCGRRMRFILQVCSYENVGESFGDFGTGYITQCPYDLAVFAFNTAR